jgi:DNA-binding transcriptional MerR regulator
MHDEAGLLTVGRLARRVGLTAKALRHYDRIGLLMPATVDPATGYRYYTADQVEQAGLVALLRSVDLPLEELRECLGADEAGIHYVLRRHRARLQARADRIRGAIHQTDHLIEDGIQPTMSEPQPTPDHKRLATDLFNGVWRLMETENRTVAEDDRMLHMAHASRYHWESAGTAVNLSRGEWQCSRVYAVLNRAEPALYHARRDLEICQSNGIADWDLAFAYEALARASAVAGDKEQARAFTDQSLAAAEDIADNEDRELLLTDLETIPGQPRYW